MNFYPHHIKDFNHSTRHLTRVERSVYRDAIEHYYVSEQPLTLDRNRLERRLLCFTDEEKSALSVVLDEFFDETEDGYFHERCDSEIQKYRSNITAKARAGKASAIARKKRASAKKDKKSSKKEHNQTSVEHTLNNCSTFVANQEPVTSNQEPVTIVKGDEPSEDFPHQQADMIGDCFDVGKAFYDFWLLYPRKDDKKKSRLKFENICDNEIVFTEIMQGLRNQIDHKWTDPKYIPLPTTWLNGERWQDEIKPTGVMSAIDEFVAMGAPDEPE